jgi:hypothetical protein
MIYKAQYIKLLMRENPLRGHVGGGWALDSETFLGPVKSIKPSSECHLGPKKVGISRVQLPTTFPNNGFARIKCITHRNVSMRGSCVVLCTRAPTGDFDGL